MDELALEDAVINEAMPRLVPDAVGVPRVEREDQQ
jgi:hypothetical protein